MKITKDKPSKSKKSHNKGEDEPDHEQKYDKRTIKQKINKIILFLQSGITDLDEIKKAIGKISKLASDDENIQGKLHNLIKYIKWDIKCLECRDKKE